ncbi:MAG: HD domain-containing protein [Kouleothrix sp.]|nr:HD domain-containing protein [Kouleothrix sp.]
MSILDERPAWERRFEHFLEGSAGGDVAHDLAHIRRVVAGAVALAQAEQADLAVVLPAAWLHDCVVVPKDSPLRAQASTLAGRAAVDFLRPLGYPAEHLPAIRHAIEAHSFSAQIRPRTREAMVVQDADRLDSLGAIGIARCLMLSGQLGRRLYDPGEPFPLARAPDDTRNTIDHFYVKLLRLAEQMNTDAGRAEALRRTEFMRAFLDQLGHELP